MSCLNGQSEFSVFLQFITSLYQLTKSNTQLSQNETSMNFSILNYSVLLSFVKVQKYD